MKIRLLIIPIVLLILFLNIGMTKVKHENTYSTFQKNGAIIKCSEESIQLEWSEFENLARSKQESEKIQKENYNIIGYLVYLFEEQKNGDNKVDQKIRILPRYESTIYFTKERCLSIKDVKSETDYLVYISYVIEFKHNKSVIVIGFDNNMSITEESCMFFKTDKKLKLKKNNICQPEEIESVTLNYLFNNREDYINKLVVVKGKINSKKRTEYEISKCLMRNDASIYEGIYSLCIPDLWPIIMKNKFRNKNYDEITVLGYLTKLVYKNEKQESEQNFSFVPISITEMK